MTSLSKLDRSQKIKIGLEATSHYGSNIKVFLTKQGFKFIELNPLKVSISRFYSQISLKRTKTDEVDCLVIAQFISTHDENANSYQQPLYHLEALKSITRLRGSYVSQRSTILIKMTNILDTVFPNLKVFSLENANQPQHYILKKYKIHSRISKWNEQDIMNIHNISSIIPFSKLEEIKKTAKNTVRNTSSYLIFELHSLIKSFESLNNEIIKLENEITTIMNDIDSPIASIPGIGTISVATIISEFGDFVKFDFQTQCVMFAELDAGISQPGAKCFKEKMVKCVSSHLRYTLMNVVKTVCIHNETFKLYWLKKKVKEKKNMRVAHSHTAKKLIRLIYHLETNQIKFDPSLSR